MDTTCPRSADSAKARLTCCSLVCKGCILEAITDPDRRREAIQDLSELIPNCPQEGCKGSLGPHSSPPLGLVAHTTSVGNRVPFLDCLGEAETVPHDLHLIALDGWRVDQQAVRNSGGRARERRSNANNSTMVTSSTTGAALLPGAPLLSVELGSAAR